MTVLGNLNSGWTLEITLRANLVRCPYSKNPHKRTSGLRTLRLKVAQKDTILHKNTFSLKNENCSYNYNKSHAS